MLDKAIGKKINKMDENWKKVSKIIIIYRQYDCKIFENNFKTITNNKVGCQGTKSVHENR